MSDYYLLCLDGPLNGQWVGSREAIDAGYWRSTWANGEEVWEHGPPGTTQGEPQEFIDAELARNVT